MLSFVLLANYRLQYPMRVPGKYFSDSRIYNSIFVGEILTVDITTLRLLGGSLAVVRKFQRHQIFPLIQ